MLVLSRKIGESIVIGDNVRVVVLRINGAVRLGVEAPDYVPIFRNEVYEKVSAMEHRPTDQD